MKRLCALAIGALVLVALFTTYSWHKAEEDLKLSRTVREESWGGRVYLTVAEDIFEFGYMDRAFEDLLEKNASEDEIVEYAGAYYLMARHVERVFIFLSYELYEGGYFKYYKIGRAFGNLERFFIDIRSKRGGVNRTETIRTNIETFREISRIARKIGKYGDPRDIPEELADELLNTTKNLKLVYE